MCGIYLALSRTKYVPPSPNTLKLLQQRGPDSIHQFDQEIINSGNESLYISCVSTVLSLRGQQTTPQPVGYSSGQDEQIRAPFLCWNGEAWSFAGKSIPGNDSSQVFKILSHVSRSVFSSAHDAHEQAMSAAFAMLSGPYAFAYFDESKQRVYFGRDILGRRSLLYHTNDSGDFILSSVSDAAPSNWSEVEADGIYWTDLVSRDEDQQFSVHKLPYERAIEIEKSAESIVMQECETLHPSAQRPLLCSSSASVSILERLLRRSLSLRIRDIPTISIAANGSQETNPARLAILFSGGLDCTVLARLAHDILDPDEPIDLLNVAFENPRVHKQPQSGDDAAAYSPYELCPDRVTGRSSFAELQAICPGRQWTFIAVNIPYIETLAHRNAVITLIHPHNTEMDLSIGYALYFAARGSGITDSMDGTTIDYMTTARVLLSGLGADELFAGYTRHGTAFTRRGFPGLVQELDLDVGRLGKRNLGRDDRVISNWSREARFPFLDEDLVRWAVDAPVWQKCGFGEVLPSEHHMDESESLDPSKKVLRCLAWKLNMRRVANEKKRAIQFGARTAKMEAGKTKGTQLIG